MTILTKRIKHKILHFNFNFPKFLKTKNWEDFSSIDNLCKLKFLRPRIESNASIILLNYNTAISPKTSKASKTIFHKLQLHFLLQHENHFEQIF